jgi:hypothetical protein
VRGKATCSFTLLFVFIIPYVEELEEEDEEGPTLALLLSSSSGST